jgi:hypothetical protein
MKHITEIVGYQVWRRFITTIQKNDMGDYGSVIFYTERPTTDTIYFNINSHVWDSVKNNHKLFKYNDLGQYKDNL